MELLLAHTIPAEVHSAGRAAKTALNITSTIVGSHLVEPMQSFHVAVVASEADGHRQFDDLSVATCCSHGVVSGVIGVNHANVTLVKPITKHDTFCFGPFVAVLNKAPQLSGPVFLTRSPSRLCLVASTLQQQQK